MHTENNMTTANLRRLTQTTLLMDFIKRHDGNWNDDEWLQLLNELAQKGYAPINHEQLARTLAAKRAAYWAITCTKQLR
jgi:hypothetical protein